MSRRRYWILPMAVGLVAALLTVIVIRAPRTVPLAETSEVYRQYRHLPGVRAAFIRQMPINDTLRLDMTLLEAEDSAAFADLLRAMGEREEFIHDMATLREFHINQENGYNVRYTGDWKSPSGIEQEVSYFPVRRCVAVFHTRREEEQKAVFKKSIYGELDIDKHK